MAAKKRTQPKSKQASKSRPTKSLKSKPAKKKAVSTKKKTTSKKKVISKAKKASASKKPAAKKKTTKKKTASIKPQVRAQASKKKAAPPKASAPKKTKKSTQRPRLSTFSTALKLYETGFKLMQSEKLDKAKKAFDALIKEFPDETELLDRAHVLTQACDNRIREARKTSRPQGADEYYEVGIAELNGQDIDKALEHLQNALKLSPKADHIHYALAAASALKGDRETALDFLGKAIQYRDENRFLAPNDDDFESLSQDSDFIGLITRDAG
jgi:tetratricopeptide (TPR) repeat protein